MSIAPIQLLKLEGRDNTYAGLDDPRDKFVFLSAFDGGTGTQPLFPDTFAEGGLLVQMTDHKLFINTATGGAVPTWIELGAGGGGSPAGFAEEVQFNAGGGNFGADGDFVRALDGSYFMVRSVFAPTVETLFLQDVNLFGIGVDGVFNGYSDNNFLTSFIGTLTGNFTGVGGADNSMIVGYQSFSGGAVANTNYIYASATNEAQTRIEASTLTHQAQINLEADGSGEALNFNFGGSNRYSFPVTQPTIGTVLGYVSANTLGWVAAPTASLNIGDAITGGTANRILYENSTNTLQESADLGWIDSTGQFHVSFAGSNRLLINPASNQYYIGNGGTGDTLVEILDTGGGTSEIRNWVTGAFVVSRGNAGARLIDGNTNTFNLYLGDVGNTINGTSIEILDSVKALNIIAHTSGGSGGLIKIGDPNSAGNSTMLQIDDFSGQGFFQTNGDFGVQKPNGQRVLDLNFSGGTDFLFNAGDVNNGGNSSKLNITDSARRMSFSTGGTDRFIVYQDWTLIGNAFVTNNWQSYTGAGNVTMNNNVSGLVYNPASVNATATIDLPATAGGTGSNITIVFGGTITSGNPVVTALTITAGAGNTLVASSIPSTVNAGDSLTFHKEGAFWYQVL